MSAALSRHTIFITHAAPEDNEFALWLSSKLAIAGYSVWLDRRRLKGGDDFWDEIDCVLRNETIKQIIVFTHHVSKPGVKKELAIGEVMKRKLSDPKFMIPVRADNVSFSDAPPEFIRDNILDGYPNWHECLKELFDTLEIADVPKNATPDAEIIKTLVEAREEGRRFIKDEPEKLLTNWFLVTPPQRIRFYEFDAIQERMKAWLAACSLPHVPYLRLAATFADPVAFSQSSSSELKINTAYDLEVRDFLNGKALGPYTDKSGASNTIVNLLRQHFNELAKKRGLVQVEFANKEIGWFFPDEIIPGKAISFVTPDGRRVRRSMSGKFQEFRWHVCLVAKPRIWPDIVYRIHINVVLSTDGKTALPGDKTHTRRRRVTKSWWNDVWRDRLLAAMHFLADGNGAIVMETGFEEFSVSAFPIVASIKFSYEATDPPLPSEENEDGNIVPSAALDEQRDELGGNDDGEYILGSDEEDQK